MDELLALKRSVAIRRLQTAVRESQATSRASYAAKNRPHWWKENSNVTLPDGSIAKTGRFISHAKCAWKPAQVQAALALYYRHCDEHASSASEHNSDCDTPPQNAPQRIPAKTESRPCRTRSKAEQASVQNAKLVGISPQKFASEPLTSTSKPGVNKKFVTFNEKHELNVHHTPPRDLRRNKRVPESRKNSKRSTHSKSRRNEKEESGEMKVESEMGSKDSIPSSSHENGTKAEQSIFSPGKPVPRRRLLRKVSARTVPSLSSTRSNPVQKGEPAVINESPQISKRKGKNRTTDVFAKDSSDVNIDCDAPSETGPGNESESTPPNGTMLVGKRRSPRLSATEDVTPKEASGVKRSLDYSSADNRTPLAPLQNHHNINVSKDAKRRKTAVNKVTRVRTARKSCRKEAARTRTSLNDSNSEKENISFGDGTTDEQGGEKEFLNVRHSSRLRPSPQTSRSGDVIHRSRVQDASTAEAEENNDDNVENDTDNEDGDYVDAGNQDCEVVDDSDGESLTQEERKERYDLIMSAIASLERAGDDCDAQLNEHHQRLAKDLEEELNHKLNKLNQHYQMRLMHMSEQEKSTLVGEMVYELDGDVRNLLVKEVEQAADSILNKSCNETGSDGGSSHTQLRLRALKTPKARSLRKAAVDAATARKRVNRERCEAARQSVRRSTRKAARTATARTREILTSAARPKSVASISGVEAVERGVAAETEISTPVVEAVQIEISRLRGLPNGRERLRALKAQLDGALNEIV